MSTVKELDYESLVHHMEPKQRIRKITNDASSIDIKNELKASQYLKTGNEMLMSANSYAADGALEFAYTLYVRYLTIFCEKFRHHPGYKDISSDEKAALKKKTNEVMTIAEMMRQKLLVRFENDYKEYLLKAKSQQKILAIKTSQERANSHESDEESKSSSTSVHTVHSAPVGKNKGYEDRPPAKFSFALPSKAVPGYLHLQAGGSSSDTSLKFNIDATKKDRDIIYPSLSSSPSFHQPGNRNSLKKNENSTPKIDRASKPDRLLSPISCGLRQMTFPADLTPRFLNLASSNTRLNIETCGVLAGKLMHGKLVITHIIIPKQKGTSDSCNTMHEEEIFQLQLQHSLISMGWIHTHPTQTAFLSSIDLHTQFAYQTMLPEAIAIVCAPSYDAVGVFTLSLGAGMETIANCTKAGFHPHDCKSELLFEDATHVIVEDCRNIAVLELRS